MSDSSVQQVKDRISITDVVGQHVQLKKAGKNLTGRCPFHKERTPSFFVSPERGTYICFGCGEKGDIFSFIEKVEGIDFKTALRQLAEKAGVVLPKYQGPVSAQEKDKEERLRDACEEAAKFFEAELQKRKDILDYLHKRGVKDETISTWRIGYAPPQWRVLAEHLAAKKFTPVDIVEAGLIIKSEKNDGRLFDRFRGRIMFPINDAGGNVIAFSGRYFEKTEGSKEEGEPAKYVNSPETVLFRKSRVLYGFDRARASIRKADAILLVEGQFDLILSHQSGLPFTVALSGTALTQEHLSLLGRLSKRLILALDADAAGLRSGLKSAAMALAGGFDVKIPAFPDGKDPADIAAGDPADLKAAVRASQTAVEFFLDALRPQAKDERGYKKLVESQVLPLVAAIQSKIDQEHFVHTIAERLRVSDDAVRAEVRKRPKLPAAPEAASDTAGAASKDSAPLAALEQAAGMLLWHFEGSALPPRLTELLGEGRTAAIREKTAEQSERLRFQFEALGDEVAAAEALLNMIERGIIDEDAAAARDELRAAERSDDTAKVEELTKKIRALAHRKQELRT